MSILRRRPLSLACAAAFAIWAPMPSAQAAEVRLYEHCNYAGYSIPLGSGAHDLGGLRISGLVNDDISSVQVPPGMQVTLYEHAGYQGRAITLTSDAPCLVHAGFNDIMSSAVVQQAGVPQGYSAPAPMNDPVRVEPYSTVAGWNIGVARDAGTSAFIGCVLQTFDNDGELLIGFDVTPKILKIGVPAAGRSGIISGAVQADSLPWTAADFESDGRVATANFSEATWPFTNVDDGRVFRVNLAGRLMEWDIAHSTQAFDQFEACIDTNSPQPGGYATMTPPPALTAYDIGSARFAQGEFRHLGGGQWVELGDNGGQFSFVELSRNADYVYLDDPSRNIQIRIGVPGRMIDVDQGQGWTPLYPVTQLHR